ncbi:hypothetical protein K9U40_12195 [Xanthobacter autotrophicus]|uniref:hypothetical protein n=1 Tax=Xanthobacter TaxID=279 RepID=UPI0024AB229E|nr:hypothetical protein [Xanthobacter autotrophicus]MDI4665082.1 hypothetical protein [Xanthobacter autotrophicus]
MDKRGTGKRGTGTRGTGKHATGKAQGNGGGDTRAVTATDFEPWLSATYAENGGFTALVVLVRIAEPEVIPLASTFLNIVGDDVSWSEIVTLFAGARQAWDGAAFFAQLDADGPLENGEARGRLRALEQRLDADRLVINEGVFFDALGRRLKVEEISTN